MKEVYGSEETERIAIELLKYMDDHHSHILALSGDLGTGKTTLVQVLAKQFGITSAIQSPTFTILKSYEISHPRYTHFVHVDAYRITNEDELIPLRFSEYLKEENFVCIEWPEQIPHALEHILQTIAQIEHRGDTREIHVYEKK